jgi:hypothetical protein
VGSTTCIWLQWYWRRYKPCAFFAWLSGVCVKFAGSLLIISFSHVHGDRLVGNWKSEAGRTFSTLAEFPFYDEESIQNIVLHGSNTWLTEILEAAGRVVPPAESEGGFEGINKVFELVQVLSIPCLAFLFGFPFEISGYTLAQRSLYDASSNLSITEQLRNLRRAVLSFSEHYV